MEAAAHIPAVRSVPTGSAAVAAAVGPRADAVDVALGAGRRIVGVLGARRGYIGVGLGCRIGRIAVGGCRIAAGRTRGGEAGVGKTAVAGCYRRIAEATCRIVGLWVDSAVLRVVKLPGCMPCALLMKSLGSQVLKTAVVGQTSYVRRCRLRQVNRKAPSTYAPSGP